MSKMPDSGLESRATEVAVQLLLHDAVPDVPWTVLRRARQILCEAMRKIDYSETNVDASASHRGNALQDGQENLG